MQLSLSAVVAIALALHAAVALPVGGVRYATVSPEVINSRLGKYGGNNKQREQTLKQLFADAGCDDQHLSEQIAKGSKLPNVVCVLPGRSDRYVIVGAHFDRVSEGDGVVDNWSGASLLPSLYESLASEPRTHTYIFIGFTDEEQGEVGSHSYARQMSQSQISVTDAMVNMDTLGLGPTKIWVSHSDKQLTDTLVQTANQLRIPVAGVNVEKIGASSDGEQFAEKKIPRITIHSFTQESFNARIIHTSRDRLSAIQLEDYYQTYRLIAAYLALLDESTGIRSAPSTP